MHHLHQPHAAMEMNSLNAWSDSEFNALFAYFNANFRNFRRIANGSYEALFEAANKVNQAGVAQRRNSNDVANMAAYMHCQYCNVMDLFKKPTNKLIDVSDSDLLQMSNQFPYVQLWNAWYVLNFPCIDSEISPRQPVPDKHLENHFADPYDAGRRSHHGQFASHLHSAGTGPQHLPVPNDAVIYQENKLSPALLKPSARSRAGLVKGGARNIDAYEINSLSGKHGQGLRRHSVASHWPFATNKLKMRDCNTSNHLTPQEPYTSEQTRANTHSKTDYYARQTSGNVATPHHNQPFSHVSLQGLYEIVVKQSEREEQKDNLLRAELLKIHANISTLQVQMQACQAAFVQVQEELRNFKQEMEQD